MTTIILLSLGGAVLAAVVGTVWYSSGTPMGKLHMKSLGFDKLSPEEQQRKIAEAMPTMPKVYAAQILLSFMTAFAVVYTVTTSVMNGIPTLMAIGFPIFNWLCFTVPVIGSAILWGNVDRSLAWKKFFSDILSNLVTIVLIAFLATLFV